MNLAFVYECNGDSSQVCMSERRIKRRWGLQDLFITNYLCIALRMLVKSLITRVNVTLLSLWNTYKCTYDTNCKHGGLL